MVVKGVAVIIPARYASSRLPGKPLLDIGGKPMIQHVWERARGSCAEIVAVATDDLRIARVVEDFGGMAVMTSPDHATGTDRVAEAAQKLGADIVINVQGDEPLLAAAAIDALIAPMGDDPALVMATLAHPLESGAEMFSPDVVKVVCDRRGFACYFSRGPIPYDRDGFAARGVATAGPVVGVLRHMGIYGYRRDFLQTFARLSATPLENIEKLEQLRALEHGYPVRVVVVPYRAIGVDTPADLERVRRLVADGGNL